MEIYASFVQLMGILHFGLWMSDSEDVEKLKKLILHNPFILTLPEVGDVKDDLIPKNVQQFWVGSLVLAIEKYIIHSCSLCEHIYIDTPLDAKSFTLVLLQVCNKGYSV